MGSGLDLDKLTDTIRQVSVEEPFAPVLVCHSPEYTHSWVHLSAQAPRQFTDGATLGGSWSLTCGYPYDLAPEREFKDHHVTLPLSVEWGTTKPQVFTTLRLPGNISLDEMAEIIVEIMTNLQQIESPNVVEISLEYQ